MYLQHGKLIKFRLFELPSPENVAAFVIKSDCNLDNKHACRDISRPASLVDVLHGYFSTSRDDVKWHAVNSEVRSM